ncbi:MAG: TonB-dependent receptor [Pseudomonadales bacterium]|nr:TonB-dependent receptor [Pseudomonadales bacterium]
MTSSPARQYHRVTFAVSCLTLLPSLSLAASTQLEEIVITAQRVEQSLLATPVAVTVFDQQTLQDLRITDVSDIAAHVPNLFISPTLGGSVNAAINIRGAATTVNNLSRDTSVGMYLNGVPIAKTSAAIFDMVDLQRIEVLRGPQGTLYGKNTIGGAINLITQKPRGELAARVQLGAGNYGLKEMRVSVDLPAVALGNTTFNSKIAIFDRSRDGTVENSDASSIDYDNKDQQGGRIDLNFMLSDAFSIDYAYDDFSADQRPTAIQPVDLIEGALPDSLAFVEEAIKATTSEDRLSVLANDSALLSSADVSGHFLQMAYQIDDKDELGGIEIKSITGQRELSTRSTSDFDGTALDVFRFINNNDFEQLSQEFQLIGESESLSYVAGIFYYQDKWNTFNPRWIFQFGADDFDTDNREGEDESLAAFGQVTWRPTSLEHKLGLTLGLRWTKETKEVTRLRQAAMQYSIDASDNKACVCLRDDADMPITIDGSSPINAPANLLQPLTAEDSWSETTPVIIAAYEYSENQHLYAKISTGFKSGGFNGAAVTNASFLQAFEPETLTAYELGFKNRFSDQRVQTQVATFYNDYKNFQANVLVDPVGLAVENAGEAVMAGFEFELNALLGQYWQLVLAYAYLHTEYKTYIDDGVDVKDERAFVYSPKHSYNVGFIYQPDAAASFRVDYSWQDDQWMDAKQQVPIAAYGLLSARIDFRFNDGISADGQFNLALWAKNIADEEYHVNGINFGFARYATFGEPRTYGLELMYHYR